MTVDAARIARLRAEHARIAAELHAVEDGTLPWIEARLCVTAKRLGEAFGISETAANNRLAKLTAVGLIERTSIPGRKGRKFIYRTTRPLEPLVIEDPEAVARFLEIRDRRTPALASERGCDE